MNNLPGLRKTHDSVIAQQFQDFEWLVVDGGSSDGSVEFLQDCAANFTSERDKGPFDAMNKGLERARGQYLLFLNAGDSLAAPEVLKQIAQHIHSQEPKPDFIYGDYLEQIGEQRLHKLARPSAKMFMGMFTSHQAMLYRRSALGTQRYDLGYRIASDYDFTCSFHGIAQSGSTPSKS